MTPRLAIVSAGLSDPSSSHLLASRLGDAVAAVLPVATTTVHLRDHARDIADNLVTGFPSARLAAAVADVTGADGLVVVTPTFNASYSGLFKSFVDVLEPESLAGRPVLIGATGGTERHSLVLDHALRPLFAYLRAVVVPTGVYAASSDWGSAHGLSGRIDRAAGELAALLGGPALARPGERFVPFEELLGG
ncbi:FMN reductase [Saccharothrix violaceirubra]|uniref:FMN reductase n=1 Tax=Saccharothrix violaceirubra TaxID=413306 RepID=A0A7W7T1X1_9PSEU|nr:FMN reductase [Saccharothrix violaceirubra]MBB4965054.1 FMN reductase [Saccharothrix violaceirubra]